MLLPKQQKTLRNYPLKELNWASMLLPELWKVVSMLFKDNWILNKVPLLLLLLPLPAIQIDKGMGKRNRNRKHKENQKQ